MNRQVSTHAVRVTALFCLAFGAAAESVGWGGALIGLPTNPAGQSAVYSARNGLALSVDTRWFDSGGYRPVAVEVETQTPSGSDRRIRIDIEFRDTNRRRSGSDLAVSEEFVLPAGQTKAGVTVRAPGLTAWGAMSWQASVNGRVDTALSVDKFNTIGLTTGQPVALRLLRIDADVDAPLADSRSGQTKVISSYRGTTIDDAYTTPAESWLDYSAADVVVVNEDDLHRLAKDNAERLEPLRAWVLAGGSLWVELAGELPVTLQEIEKALRLERWRFAERSPNQIDDAPIEKSTDDAAADTLADSADEAPDTGAADARQRAQVEPIEGAPGWYYPTLVIRPQDRSEAAAQLAERARRDGLFPALGELLTEKRTTEGWYAQRDAGFGRVAAFRGAALEAPGASSRGAVRLVMRQWGGRGWAARHGLEPGERCPSFGNLLIEGVGVAPVGAFQVLITLFVLAIGPLNYWLLWRRQRLHLLVLTTPLAAAAVTLALVAYAAVADGFGVKARARSVTLIDQTTGEAVSWSRVSHFVATTPDGPPEFDADTAVYPIRPAWEAAIAASDSRRELAWRDDRQSLASGWMPARTATQHLLLRHRKSPARIDFVEGEGGVRATNRLGAPVSLLLVLGNDGQWRHAVALDDGEQVELEPIARLDAVGLLRNETVENQPTFPIGAGKSVEDTLELLGASRDVRRVQQELAAVSLSDNLLNAQIQELAGVDGGRALDLPPRSYVAIATQTVETELGWPGVQEVGSFHVVAGRW